MHILFVNPNNKRFEIFCLINRFLKKLTVGAGNNDYYAIITASAATYYFWKLGLSGTCSGNTNIYLLRFTICELRI
jgi:hypothetical protein